MLAALGLTALALGPAASSSLAAAPSAPIGAGVWAGSSTATAGNPGLWSVGSNWSANAPADSSTEPLFFGAASGCAQTQPNPPAGQCFSRNDRSGLSPSSLTFDDGVPYQISGNGLTLGSDGITASTGSTTAFAQGPSVSNPITLGADQTWTLTGNGSGSASANTPPGGSVTLDGDVTGARHLTTNFSDGARLFLNGNVSVASLKATGANAGNTGFNSEANGFIGIGGDLTTSSGPVSVSNLDVQFMVPTSGTQSTGPLTLHGDQVNIGQGGVPQYLPYAGEVSSSGTVVMDANNYTNMYIDGTGSNATAGTDYAQLTAAGNVSVAGGLSLTYGGPTDSTTHCPTTPPTPGTTYSLVQATGGNTLSGTFTDIADGAVVSIGSGCSANNYQGIPVRINYTTTAVTATVLGSSSVAITGADPQSAVTNQPVTLTATVTQSPGTPAGTVAFTDGYGTPITGCQSQPVSQTNNAGPYTATCTTTFNATDYSGGGNNQPSITADYVPASGNDVAPSSSTDNGAQPYALTVNPQSTTTALSASSTSPTAGQSVTYTATVAPSTYATPTIPGYSVAFYDGSTAINCSGSNDGSLSVTNPDTATCTTSYPSAGAHSITAVYQADDGNFQQSTSSPVTVTVGGSTTTTTTTTTTSAPVTTTTTTAPVTTTTTTTTPAPPVPTPGTGTPQVSPPKVSGTTVTIPVSCATGGASCTVTSLLTAIETLKGGKVIAITASAKIIHETVLLGSATMTLKAGQHTAIKVSLNGAGRRLLAAHHNLKVHLAISKTVKGGKRQTVSGRTLRFHTPRKRH